MLDLALSTLATNCVLIGHCSKADCVWTRDEFLTICELLRNGNAPTEFLLVYRDNENRPQFAKSKTAKADRRATWAWDTITGRAKSKVGKVSIRQIPNERLVGVRWTLTLTTGMHCGPAVSL